MTKNGPEPVENLGKVKIDYDHYIEKQLKPIADSLLIFFDKSFDEIVTEKKQVSLEDFL